MRVVIELKREAVPKVVLNKLFKHSAMQSTFGVNTLALVDGVPQTLSLKDMLRHYIAHQKEVIIRRTRFELDKAKKRAHILEGLPGGASPTWTRSSPYHPLQRRYRRGQAPA